jgi:hypothetical protein
LKTALLVLKTVASPLEDGASRLENNRISALFAFYFFPLRKKFSKSFALKGLISLNDYSKPVHFFKLLAHSLLFQVMYILKAPSLFQARFRLLLYCLVTLIKKYRSAQQQSPKTALNCLRLATDAFYKLEAPKP